MCRPAPACSAALDEASTLWPNRRTTSDGICASPQHTAVNPYSDHEPNYAGLATAFDLSHDPGHGVDCAKLSRLVTSDIRTDYVIFNREIWSRRRANEGWRYYDGDNPHYNHMHVSVLDALANDTRPWFSEEDELSPEDRQYLEGKFANITGQIQVLKDGLGVIKRDMETVKKDVDNAEERGAAATSNALKALRQAEENYNQANEQTGEILRQIKALAVKVG